MSASYFIHPTAIVEDKKALSEGCKIWHFSHIMKHAQLGANCSIGQNVFIADHVRLGNNVKVQNNVSIYEGVICEDDVFLGPSMVFTNIKNPRSAIVRKGQYESTKVGRGVSIGANATIVCGITLGNFCFVGAGAVVTKDVKPYSLILGNPAIHVGWVSEYGHRLSFNENGQAICPESKLEYILEHEIVKRID